MIIDSHAHYNNNAYKKPFRYLSYDKDGYALKEGNREQLFRDLLDANVPYSIEPGLSQWLDQHPTYQKLGDARSSHGSYPWG